MSDPYSGFAQEEGDPYSGIATVEASPAPQTYSPVSGNSFLQNALIGSGKFFTDTGLGARQLLASTGIYGDPAALEQEAAEKRRLDMAIASTGGGKVGQIGTGVLTALPIAAIPGVNTYLGAAALGGGYGALTPTVQGESRAINTGVGAGLGIAGKGLGDILGNWLTARATTPSGLTEAQQQAASQGADLGMQLTPGQQAGSKALQQLEAKLEAQPWTSGPFNKLRESNQAILNSQWAKAIGENSANVDSTVLGKAADRLGDVFESVRDPNSIVAVNPETTSSFLNSVDKNIEGLVPGSIRDNPLVSQLEDLTSSGSINGEQLGTLSSKLGKAAYKQVSSPNGDRDLAQALYSVKDHVDDLLQSSLSGEQAATYGAARQQYRALMQLTARASNVNPSTGVVSGPNMASYLQARDKAGFLFGGNQSPAYQATRFAQAFKPAIGDSGTATREMSLGQLALALPGNVFSKAYLKGPLGPVFRAAASAPSVTAPPLAVGGAIAPYMGGLPGIAASVPYITQ